MGFFALVAQTLANAVYEADFSAVGGLTGLAAGLAWILAGLSNVALAELIGLLIRIEANTRVKTLHASASIYDAASHTPMAPDKPSFYYRNAEAGDKGPATLLKMKELLTAGLITGETKVYPIGIGGIWMGLADCEALRQ